MALDTTTRKARKWKRKRTLRKGGRLMWNNRKKSESANQRDCKLWNSTHKTNGKVNECSQEQYKKYYYPGKTNIGRIPFLRKEKTMMPSGSPMTTQDWCEAVKYIDDNKRKELNNRLDTPFEAHLCNPVPEHLTIQQQLHGPEVNPRSKIGTIHSEPPLQEGDYQTLFGKFP